MRPISKKSQEIVDALAKGKTKKDGLRIMAELRSLGYSKHTIRHFYLKQYKPQQYRRKIKYIMGENHRRYHLDKKD